MWNEVTMLLMQGGTIGKEGRKSEEELTCLGRMRAAALMASLSRDRQVSSISEEDFTFRL